jgi:hypothetical protein
VTELRRDRRRVRLERTASRESRALFPDNRPTPARDRG